MGRPNKKGAKSEFDEVLDEIAPETEEDEVVEAAPKEEFHQEVSQAPNETPHRDEQEELANQALLIDQEADQKAEEAKKKAEAKLEEEPVETAPAAPVASPSPEPAPTAEQLERVNQGLQNEIRKLREKSNALRQAQQVAPPPPPQPVQQVPVVEQGPDLEDLIVYKDGAAGIDRDKLRQFIAQETAPSPKAVADAQDQQFKASFMASATTPEAHQAHTQALSRTEQALEHLHLSMRVTAQAQGIPIESMPYDQVIGFLNQSGVMAEVGAQYPDVAPSFPGLLAASAMASQEMMGAEMHSYVARNAQAAPASPPAPVRAQPAVQTIQPLPVSRAPSLAGVGSATENPGTNDQARFAQLEKDFNSDPDGTSKKSYEEMLRLETKLGLG